MWRGRYEAAQKPERIQFHCNSLTLTAELQPAHLHGGVGGEESQVTQSPAYINTKKVVEHTAANSLGKIDINKLANTAEVSIESNLLFSPDTGLH